VYSLKKIYILIVTVIIISGIILTNINGNEILPDIKESDKQTSEREIDDKTAFWFLYGDGLPFEFTEDELSVLQNNRDILVINPIFTQVAYGEGGFYDYFREECDETCLTLDVGQQWKTPTLQSSAMGIRIFEELGWDMLNDLEVHKNPSLLDNYKKIIVLHNEYVTREMFDSITSHPKVIYLYPNALYAQVKYDTENNTITLIRGHSYPEKSIDNGFDWEFDNTRPYEFDKYCDTWEFYEIDNGFMLNCYPEGLIITEPELLKTILDL